MAYPPPIQAFEGRLQRDQVAFAKKTPDSEFGEGAGISIVTSTDVASTDLTSTDVTSTDVTSKVDIKLVLWEYGQMKTTLEIPDELMRRVKIRAVQRNQKLKDTVATLLEAGIAAVSDDAPVTRLPKPVRLKTRRLMTIDDIETAIASGRDKRAPSVSRWSSSIQTFWRTF